MESRTIHVFGKPIKIIPIDGEETNPLYKVGGELGRYKLMRNAIYFDKNQPIAQIHDTILHELLHVIDLDLALKLEEDQIYRLACGLYSVFRENPEFAKWIIK